MDSVSRTDEFLVRNGMHPDCVDIAGCKAAFIEDMQAGLDGKQSSLRMIPTYLASNGQASEGETAIAIDIGGTNLRVALTKVCNGQLVILESSVTPAPGLSEEISKDMFFQQIADRVTPIMNRSDTIGVCFSHAAQILPNRDGRLISFSKEIRVRDAAGMEITKGLAEKLGDAGVRKKMKLTLVNDTAAVLLSGITNSVEGSYDGHIGFVLGTGMNISYIEKTSEIKKLSGSFDKSTMLVNTEAGDFNRVPPGAFDTELDKHTANPGTHLLEKMMSGKYLGQLILLTLKKAALEGLLSPRAATSVLALSELLLPETSAFLSDIHGKNHIAGLCTNDSDRLVIRTVVDRIYDRAAKLAVMAIAAIMEKTDTGRRPERPVCITVEGSTFYKLYSFQDKFDHYLKSWANDIEGRYCKAISVDNATILGTSLAALINR